MSEFFLGEGKAGAGLRLQPVVLLLGIDCPVERLFEGTSWPLFTGITDIGSLLKFWAGVRNIRNTGIHTPAAGPAGSVRDRGAFGTQGADGALAFDIEQTVIEGLSHGACFFFADMFTHLLGDCGTVFAKDNGNLFEGSSFVQFSLDGGSVL